MRKKKWYLLCTLLLSVGSMFYFIDATYADELASIETNQNVGFYGEVDYDGDPRPEPPSEEQHPSEKPDSGTKPSGRLPQLNQVLKNYWWMGGLLLILTIRKWLKNRRNQIIIQVSN